MSLGSPSDGRPPETPGTGCRPITLGAMMRGVSDAPTPARPDGDEPPSERPTPPDGLPPLTPAAPPPSVAAAPPPSVTTPPSAPQPLAGTGDAGPVRPGGGGLAPLPPGPPPPRTAWGARFAVLALGALAGIAGYLAATRFLPRWWAHRIGDVSDGAFTTGITAGLVCGVAFTLLPLLVLRGVVRRSATWATRFVLLVLAFLLSVPNLITLFVVLGTNNAAHAAERTFDVQAPGFRGATLAGAVIGAVLAVGLWWLLWSRRRRKDQIADLKARLAEKDAVKPAPGDAEKDD